MSRYPFEYFCGANVVVYLDNFPLLEASGFTYSIRESKRPIYGYASRLYDAVARGQVLVEGTLLINYVHQDYLFHAAQLANDQSPEIVPLTKSPVPVEGGADTAQRILEGRDISETALAGANSLYWGETDAINADLGQGLSPTANLHDFGSFNVRVSFGNQSGDRPSGDTGLILSGLHFTGRGTTIQIDAETIVEAYSFIARNVHSTTNPMPLVMQRTEDGVTMTSGT
jgi:hypothetical protein